MVRQNMENERPTQPPADQVPRHDPDGESDRRATAEQEPPPPPEEQVIPAVAPPERQTPPA